MSEAASRSSSAVCIPDTAARKPLELAHRILGDHLLQQDARLVQHRLADAEPGAQRQPVQPERHQGQPVGGMVRVAGQKLAARHQLGQHHGGGLQRLDLLLGVVALGAVLHHQHAEHASAARNRHAHQRVIDLLAGLRPVGEVGMRLGVGQRQRPAMQRDVADQPLAHPEACLVHRLGLQPLGGEQLEHLAGAHDVGRADFGHHVGGDDLDHLVEPLLRRAAGRHDVTQAAKQQTGGGDPVGRRHQPTASTRSPASRAASAATA
jgi:hypothetical protein